MMLILQVQFTLLTLNSSDLLDIPPTIFQVLLVAVLGSIFLLVAYNAITVGQGGSRIKMDDEGKTADVNREDDQHWKLGVFYVNKNDPSIFIEKRFGIGFTINFGNPIGVAVMVGLLLLIAGFALLPTIL